MKSGVLIIISVFMATAIAENLFALGPGVLTSGDRSKRRIHNFGLGVFTRILFPVLLATPLAIAASHFGLWNRGIFFQGAFGLVFDLILLDLMNYFGHYLAHKVPLMWRFHSVHHLDQELDATTAFRTHFGEKTLLLPLKLSTLILFAIPLPHLALSELLSFAHGIFHHANLRLPRKWERVASYVFTVPTFHAVHHYADLPYTDSNYGFILSVWDAIFGTVSLRHRLSDQRHGVNERIEGRIPERFSEIVFEPLLHDLKGVHLPSLEVG